MKKIRIGVGKWSGHECQFCGAKRDMLLNVHCRLVEGLRIAWQVGAGKLYVGDDNCSDDEDFFEPLRGGYGHPYNRDEDSDWHICLACGKVQGFDAAAIVAFEHALSCKPLQRCWARVLVRAPFYPNPAKKIPKGDMKEGTPCNVHQLQRFFHEYPGCHKCIGGKIILYCSAS